MKIQNQMPQKKRDINNKEGKISVSSGNKSEKNNASAIVEFGNRKNTKGITYKNPIFQKRENDLKQVSEENKNSYKNTANIESALNKIENSENKSMQTVFKGLKALTSIIKTIE